MKELIDRLDEWIKQNRTAYYKELNTGLTDSEIKNWEEKFGFEFPEDFRILYQWKNGQPANNREYFFAHHYFDSIEMVYDQWKFGKNELAEDNEDGYIAWGESWLRLMSMLTSDGYCLDVKGDLGETGTIVYYMHNDTNEVVYPSLKTMLEIIVNQFEQGVYGYKITDNGTNSFQLTNEEKAAEIQNNFM